MTAQVKLAQEEAVMFRGFSCPFEPLDSSFLETIAIEYGREFAKRFLCHCSSSLRKYNGELLQFLDDALGNQLSFETVWHSSFGETRRAIVEKKLSDAVSHAVNLGIRLVEHGHTGKWGADLTVPTQVAFGRWLLPRSSRLDVISKFREVTICGSGLDGAFDARFLWRANQWKLAAAHNFKTEGLELIHSWKGKNCVLLPCAPGLEPAGATAIFVNKDKALAISSICEAIAIIERCAPAFLPWVARVLRGLVSVRSGPGKICSGSYQDAPGTIYLSVDCPAIAIAEILIHEASHQYYYLLARYGSLLVGRDRLYFSPIKRTKRPLTMILLAYHAFANVALFYRLCRRVELADNDYCYENYAQLMPQLRVLQDTLASSKSLSPLGEALWKPLAARL